MCIIINLCNFKLFVKGAESLFICVLMRFFIGKERQNIMRMRMLVVHGMQVNYRVLAP